MIILQSLNWDNWFSYGEGNYLDLASEPLIQIKGSNGHGKSSIPLIIQEVLFGSNTKGIKKSDLSNRYTDGPLRAVLNFEVNNLPYNIEYSRKGAKVTLKFQQKLNDLSGHTTAQTYKKIKEVLGIDFELFSSLTYQSSNSNLGFLTATDTNRKKFLSSLLNLEEYLSHQKLFKDKSKEFLSQLHTTEGSISAITSSINSIKSADSTKKELLDVPVADPKLGEEVGVLRSEIKNIAETNSRISTNNSILTKIENFPKIPRLAETYDTKEDLDCLNALRVNVGKHITEKQAANSGITKLKGLSGTCPGCLQDISSDIRDSMLSNFQETYNKANNEIDRITKEADSLKAAVAANEQNLKSNTQAQAQATRLQDLTDSLTAARFEDEVSLETLETKLKKLSKDIAEDKASIAAITDKNSKATTHNASVELRAEELKGLTSRLLDAEASLSKIRTKLEDLMILEDSFSMKGLISYKIEALLKGLEATIVAYLGKLSDGALGLSFIVSGDKLNVDIFSNGSTVGISSLSTGELAKVNIATLLAIRNILVPINVLFLDEIAGVLDSNGKDALVEVMQAESCNCFLVDHSFTHPLVEYIEVIKTNNISRIKI